MPRELSPAGLLRRWTDDLVLITGDAMLTDEERRRLAGAGIG